MILSQEQEKDPKFFLDPATGAKLEYESQPLLEWLANNFKKFGTTLEIVTNKSQEGSQFVKGFGGIGGLLRYQVNFDEINQWKDHIDDADDISDFI
jgi:peptide chain release factor subunit 1